MEKCGQQACTRIQITNIPLNGSSFGLTTPNGVVHTFEYDYNGTSSAEFPIQIRPPGYGTDSLEDIKHKVVLTIINTGLFGNCYYDSVYNNIWVCQKIVGIIGNQTNVNVSNFGGGEDEPSKTTTGNAADIYEESVKFEKQFNQKKVQEAKRLSEEKKKIREKQKKAANCNPSGSKSKSGSPLTSSSSGQRKFPCPTCNDENKVKDKIAGKNYFQIPFTDFKVPRFDHLVDKVPTFDENRREGETCGACKGSKEITDVADDSAKYQKVAQKIEENSEKILEKESKLGLGGTRTTIIQGSELLFVGLGFNNNKTYETIPGGSIAPTMKGGKIPQQNSVPINAVVGKQGTLAWPQQVGNYTIKCANKFSLLAGAGGITMATPGPLTFSAGMMKFVGPQIAIGCTSGPLTLEGDSVNITGKAVSITPTGGELFVKGSINNTGNVTVQGHAHFESMSFAKAACVGINKSTLTATANPDVVNTQRATWGKKAVSAALMDLQAFYQSVPMDSDSSSFRLMSPKENQNIADRLKSIAKLSLPWEIEVTGYILPYTRYNAFVQGGWWQQGGSPVTITVMSLCDIHNIPHMHGIPEMKHNHEVYLPDMDYTNDSTQGLRSKIVNGAHESGVPVDPTKDTVSRLGEVKRTVVEYAAAAKVNGTRNSATSVRLT